MTHHWHRYAKATLVGAVISVLAGCSVLPKTEPQAHYALPAISLQSQDQGITQAGVLFVAQPQANRLVGSNQILVQTADSSLLSYKGSLWADNVPTLLRERLINAFTDVGLFESISGDAALRSDHSLETYVQRFQIQLGTEQPTIQIQLSANLIESTTATILRSQRFQVQQVAASTAMPDVLHAFGQATDQLSLDLIQWLQ